MKRIPKILCFTIWTLAILSMASGFLLFSVATSDAELNVMDRQLMVSMAMYWAVLPYCLARALTSIFKLFT